VKRIYDQYNIRKTIATIGIFDGVHYGHQRILKKLVRIAAKENSKSMVITFHPHPRKVLNPDLKVPFLTSLEHRLKLIEEMGVDFFLVIKFTKSIARMKAPDFIKKILVDRLNIKALVVGEDFLFGHKEEGDFALLRSSGKLFGFRLFGVKGVKRNGRYISSTRIRKKIEEGDLKEASKLLNRPVSILGTVVEGRAVGRSIGFPTANIDPHHEAIPPSGVYAVRVRFGKRFYRGILNIGSRPTFFKHRTKEKTIELHIFNFKKDIYGKDVEIIFKKKIRPEKKFSSVEALRQQIQKDILRV